MIPNKKNPAILIFTEDKWQDFLYFWYLYSFMAPGEYASIRPACRYIRQEGSMRHQTVDSV